MRARAKFFSVASIVCAAVSLGAAGAASAGTADYAPGAESRNFNGGAGGWTFDTEYGGLCIPALTCFTTDSGHVASGGPTGGANDGFLRTELFTIADAVTETNAILTSPSFRYQGAGGDTPKELTLSLDRRTDLGALLPAIADNATYTVKAVQSGGAAVTLIDTTSVVGAEGAWTAVPQVNLDERDLKVGKSYQLEITTTFQPQIEVIGVGDFDYDNVLLRARGGGGNGGGQGNAGTGGGFTTGIKNGIEDAVLKGNKLLVRAGCPRFLERRCTLRITAKLNRRGNSTTETGTLRVQPGKKKTARLRIKPKFKQAIASRKRVVIRVGAQSGDKKRVVIKRVKVRKG